jgi:hypothetical protein
MLHLIFWKYIFMIGNLPDESVPVGALCKEKDTRGNTTVRNIEKIMNFDNIIVEQELLQLNGIRIVNSINLPEVNYIIKYKPEFANWQPHNQIS